MSGRPEVPENKPVYRAVILLRDNGVDRVVPLMAADDQEAIAQASALVDCHAVDLWDGLRFIEHFVVVRSDA